MGREEEIIEGKGKGRESREGEARSRGWEQWREEEGEEGLRRRWSHPELYIRHMFVHGLLGGTGLCSRASDT